MSYWAMLGCALVGLGIVFLVVPLALRAAPLRKRLERGQDLHHTHQKPTPRLGGLALAIAFIGVEAIHRGLLAGTTDPDAGPGGGGAEFAGHVWAWVFGMT